MGLITYTNIEDGQTADANKFNQRFGAIIDAVNGNLDSQNLANGAVTEPKIATGAVTSDKIDIDKYIDDNGWTVQDFGTYKTYTRSVSVINATIPAGVRKDDLPTFLPPIGRTRDNIIMGTTWYGGYAGQAIPGVEPSGSDAIAPMLANQYVPGPLTFNGVIFVTAVDA